MGTLSDEDTYVAFRTETVSPQRADLLKRIQMLEEKITEIDSNIKSSFTWPFMSNKKRKRLGRWRMDKIIAEGQRNSLVKEGELLITDDSPLRQQYREMLAIPRVKRILVVQKSQQARLEIYTDVLYGKEEEGTSWHAIGEFCISVNLTTAARRDILFINLSRVVVVPLAKDTAVKRYGPTRIEEDGHVSCYGNAGAVIDTALSEKDDVGLVSILVRYPECPGQYNHIVHWPKVDVSEVPQWYKDTFGQ